MLVRKRILHVVIAGNRKCLGVIAVFERVAEVEFIGVVLLTGRERWELALENVVFTPEDRCLARPLRGSCGIRAVIPYLNLLLFAWIEVGIGHRQREILSVYQPANDRMIPIMRVVMTRWPDKRVVTVEQLVELRDAVDAFDHKLNIPK